MYEISVSIMCQSLNEETRSEYLRQLKVAGASRVFLALNFMEYSREERRSLMREIAEKIAFFREGGIDAGVWISHSIGMELSLASPGFEGNQKYTYRHLVNLNGDRACLDAPIAAYDFVAFEVEG